MKGCSNLKWHLGLVGTNKYDDAKLGLHDGIQYVWLHILKVDKYEIFRHM